MKSEIVNSDGGQILHKNFCTDGISPRSLLIWIKDNWTLCPDYQDQFHII